MYFMISALYRSPNSNENDFNNSLDDCLSENNNNNNNDKFLFIEDINTNLQYN